MRRDAQDACRGTKTKNRGLMVKPPGSLPVRLVCGRSAAHQPEAVAAVDGPRPCGPERHLRLLAATGAGRVEELARTTGVAAATAVAVARATTHRGTALRATRRTALGRRGESLLLEELLLGGGEDEVDAAIRTLQHLVGVGHE